MSDRGKHFAKPFYDSKAWHDVRDLKITMVHGLCERCGKPGYIVHHKKELNESNVHDPSISLALSNLEYVCIECHNKVHGVYERKDVTAEGMRFDSNGELVKG